MNAENPREFKGKQKVGPSCSWLPSAEHGFRQIGMAALVALAIVAPMAAIGGHAVYGTWRAHEDARLAGIKLQTAFSDLQTAPPLPALPVDGAARGRDLFAAACVACHGPNARGVEGLGRDLVVSNFVAARTDEQLAAFIAQGRPNAKPVAMPPKAGRDDLTDGDLRHIVVYLRGLQDPRRMPELPAPVADATPSAAQKEAALAAAGGDAELAGYIASGDKIFHSLCLACHGKGGTGIAGNGKALRSNDFIRSLDDDGLLAFIKTGRAPTDPKSTTGIQMPPKGGNPAMSDDDILDVIAYLRTLQGTKPGVAAGK